jgi:predicted nucleic acid-binding protein
MGVEIEFVDTNVLYYAHDRSAGEKRVVARELIEKLDSDRRGAISIQVLQEFSVTVLAKGGRDLKENDLADILEDLSDWIVFSPGASDVIDALALRRRYGISFWDAMIIQAAIQVKAPTIWSEDLNDGQEYGGVTVRNPFGPKGSEGKAAR